MFKFGTWDGIFFNAYKNYDLASSLYLVLNVSIFPHSMFVPTLRSYHITHEIILWPGGCTYITWNMVERKKWKQMIRPAIRNVFDSQSTRKNRASWRRKKEFLPLGPPIYYVYISLTIFQSQPLILNLTNNFFK